MILCCGEALIDMIPTPMGAQGQGDGGQGYVPHVGGSVLNTALALGRLGVATGLLTGLSSDRFGRLIGDSLRASHVDMTPAVQSDRPTTLAFVHLDGGEASYSFYDECSATRQIVPGDLVPLPATTGALFFGGISLCNRPVADTLEGLAASWAGRIPIMLDPNIRPGFAIDCAAYRDRLNRLIGLADIVKVSDPDTEWLLPDLPDPEDRARHLLTLGPALVIRTRGDRGAVALSAGHRVEIAAPKVQVADTIGAGDAFNAGVLARLVTLGQLDCTRLRALTPATLRDVLGHAAQVAALTVTRSGANPPWAHDLTDAKQPGDPR